MAAPATKPPAAIAAAWTAGSATIALPLRLATSARGGKAWITVAVSASTGSASPSRSPPWPGALAAAAGSDPGSSLTGRSLGHRPANVCGPTGDRLRSVRRAEPPPGAAACAGGGR